MPEQNGNGSAQHGNPAFNSYNGHLARKATSARSSYCQAVKLQQLIIRDAVDHGEVIQSTDKNLRATAKPTDLAALARAWCDLEETKRKLKMKPLPGSLRPTEAKRRPAKEPVTFAPTPEPPPA